MAHTAKKKPNHHATPARSTNAMLMPTARAKRLETRKLPPGFEVVLVSAVYYFFRQRGSVHALHDTCPHWHSGFSG